MLRDNTPLKLKVPMTLVGAMFDDDDDQAILIGADSVQIDSPGPVILPHPGKLRRHETAPLAWAFTGSIQVTTQDFSRELAAAPWPPMSWSEFVDQVGERFARMNGRQRELHALAHGTPGVEIVTSMLMVGWIGDRPGIYEFNDQGSITPYTDERFQAIGAGGAYAKIIREAYKRVTFDAPAAVRFGLMMQLAIDITPNCTQPLKVWRVKPEGIADVMPATESAAS